MTSTTQNQINRLQEEIADLRVSDAHEAEKEIELNSKIFHTKEAEARTNSALTRQSKLKEVKHMQTNLNKVQIKRAKISREISRKENQLTSKQNRRLNEIRQETNRQLIRENS